MDFSIFGRGGHLHHMPQDNISFPFLMEAPHSICFDRLNGFGEEIFEKCEQMDGCIDILKAHQ